MSDRVCVCVCAHLSHTPPPPPPERAPRLLPFCSLRCGAAVVIICGFQCARGTSLIANRTMRHCTRHYLGKWENGHLVCQGKLQAREFTITSPARPARGDNRQSSSRLRGEMSPMPAVNLKWNTLAKEASRVSIPTVITGCIHKAFSTIEDFLTDTCLCSPGVWCSRCSSAGSRPQRPLITTHP